MHNLNVISIIDIISLSFAFGLLTSYIAVRLVTRHKKASDEEILSKAHKTFYVSDEKVTLNQTIISDEVKNEVPSEASHTTDPSPRL